MIRRLWKRFGCIIHGHDLELKRYLLNTPKGLVTIIALQCKHCGKVVMK